MDKDYLDSLKRIIELQEVIISLLKEKAINLSPIYIPNSPNMVPAYPAGGTPYITPGASNPGIGGFLTITGDHQTGITIGEVRTDFEPPKPHKWPEAPKSLETKKKK